MTGDSIQSCFSPARASNKRVVGAGWARVSRQRAAQFHRLPDPAQRCLCCIRLGVWRHSAGEGSGECAGQGRVGGTGPFAPGKLGAAADSIQTASAAGGH